ncbi:hypothetical protein SNE35_31465 [Paucibacter sp. R3-3]|uniref:Uncharacterized protein n=1 Tax=Roseateles agri TaxID=3098619 RepID=A0ABU5DT27_9BURK|nr:hypothetical protein [Paucibacter sp. R3-3]MDY0749058.1 hypothetical protein [Paucibacter sp. R3-3]
MERIIMHDTSSVADQLFFELFFPTLRAAGRSLSFPCDAKGCVALDSLSEPARNNYFLARTLMGWAYGAPRVMSCVLSPTNRQCKPL